MGVSTQGSAGQTKLCLPRLVSYYSQGRFRGIRLCLTNRMGEFVGLDIISTPTLPYASTALDLGGMNNIVVLVPYVRSVKDV
ncbi:hypothetical protein CC1G_14839 [Coprinopsis cinerea okayama7|uniref:Uncharacterized protein n=1 Tax=Coprinopsis cinerea (strain Okayama-7 / 130 / ATCC MYA-4618 / FGSC 9003) TaxID=240176 RepID=D6RNI9_COPC7|nr:hypothetical protein CC1G_14839 [Coprinopsis cinerea okayama7\|eukprot:XP_002910860.1 hypothetical protein CC1G_14839 [Coprinopsis cinerea okayama7\